MINERLSTLARVDLVPTSNKIYTIYSILFMGLVCHGQFQYYHFDSKNNLF